MVPEPGRRSSPTCGQQKRKCTQQLGQKHREASPANHGGRLSLQGAREAKGGLLCWVALAEFEDETRKHGVGFTSDMEHWAFVDDITLATTAELAPFVMAKLT